MYAGSSQTIFYIMDTTYVLAVLRAPGHEMSAVRLRQVFMMFVIGTFMLEWPLEQHTFGISASARRFRSS